MASAAVDPYRFSILLSLSIPSFFATLFFLYYFFYKKRELSRQIGNHIIMMLVLTNFVLICTELPLTLIYLYTGSVAIPTNQFCKFWTTQSYTLIAIGLYLMCYGSFERYLLIFYNQFLNKHKLLFHYLPIAVCFLYPFLIYLFSIVLNVRNCQETFSYGWVWCGGHCYQYGGTYALVLLVVNIIMPISLSVLINVVLVVQVLALKRRMKQQNLWRRNRRLIIQLLCISSLYISVWIPIIVAVTLLIYLPNLTQVLSLYNGYFAFSTYLVPIFCPFVSLIGVPELRNIAAHKWNEVRRVAMKIPTRIEPSQRTVTAP